MKRFADINLKIFDEERMVKLAKEYGFQTIAISISESSHIDQLIKLGEKYGLAIIRRVNLKPSTISELVINLNRWRLNCEIIAVECNSATITKQAAKDRRVDLLNFPIQNLKLFNKPVAELTSNTNVALEVIFNHLIKSERRILPKTMRMLRLKIALARKYKIPVIGSSGASSILELRAPRDMAAFFHLLGLSLDDAVNAFSKYPLEIVNRNRAKLKTEYIGEGVRLI